MKEIIVHEKYPEYFETNIEWQVIRSHRIWILIDVVKELVWDCVLKIKKSPTIEDYERLKSTWMLWEFHPEATWNYNDDKHLLYNK